MADQEKPTRILRSTDLEKTRLVRRDAPNSESASAAPSQEEPKTRMAFRSRDSSASEIDETAIVGEEVRLVTGWLVVVGGPGRGRFAAVHDGMNSVGRGADQATQLDFGDETISRSEHAFVTYDYKDRKFYLQHGGKASIVRLNDQPVLQPTELKSGDAIFLGSTTLRFVALCGSAFDWKDISY